MEKMLASYLMTAHIRSIFRYFEVIFGKILSNEQLIVDNL